MNFSSKRTQQSGFTLTELMIVIVIIAVLALIAIPISLNVRNKATAVTCGSNMKQIAALGHLFAGDHNGKLPRLHVRNTTAAQDGFGTDLSPDDRIVNNPNVHFWPDLLAAYGDIASICSCPKLKEPATTGMGGGFSTRYSLGIGINYGYTTLAPNDPNVSQWIRNTNVDDDARLVWFADAGSEATGPWEERVDAPGEGGCFFRGQHADAKGVMPRHGGKLNVAFVDGHVEFVRPEQINWGAHGSGNGRIGYTIRESP
ncbi:MAG: prepilin-type N-terminal cleavage/methylation domain-containing protein [Akkermansiaceae bacterium]